MVRETFVCLRAPHDDGAAYEGNRIYMLTRRHFLMDINSRQYKLMLVAMLDTLKYCLDKEFTVELKSAWQVTFSSILRQILKYSIALEIMYTPQSGQSSYASSFIEYSTMGAPDGDNRIVDNYCTLSDEVGDNLQEKVSSYRSDENSMVTGTERSKGKIASESEKQAVNVIPSSTTKDVENVTPTPSGEDETPHIPSTPTMDLTHKKTPED